MADKEPLSTPGATEMRIRSETDCIPRVCKCGKTFPHDQTREFMLHTLDCPEGTPISPPGAERPAHRVTLPQKL